MSKLDVFLWLTVKCYNEGSDVSFKFYLHLSFLFHKKENIYHLKRKSLFFVCRSSVVFAFLKMFESFI